MKAILLPSGDHDGWAETDTVDRTRIRALPPFLFMTASESPPAVKAIL